MTDALDPLFSMVEIEINSRCNRRCGYCPNAIAPRRARRLMALDSYERILDRLVEVGFAGRLSYHFYNEPLLHPELAAFVARTRARLPTTRQVLYTNGDHLTRARHAELLAAGVDRFIVTQHDGAPGEPMTAVTWQVPEQLDLTNRGGLLAIGRPRPHRPCHAPASMLIVTIEGNVVLCYEDATETVVVGNVFTTPIAAIWWSSRFRRLRHRLAAGDRSATAICSACSNQAHVSPEAFDHVL
jgi:radical SAM protein with 4Fe4S-binding SPASM domain